MEVSKYEYTMQLLAAMASINIAREQKISRTKAFFRFMKSQTAAMLFDESTDMWMNGPDYIADEYRRERLAKTVGQKQKDENEMGDHLIFEFYDKNGFVDFAWIFVYKFGGFFHWMQF